MRTLWIFLGFFLVFGQAHAGWVPVATVNEKTPGHLCDVDDNGLDLFCGDSNPEIIANGAISATGISTTSLFVNGTEITGSGGGGGSADEVISGTTNITANENSSISFTTAGTERMILTDSGQLALGEGMADPSAILDISTTTQGVLPPRLTTAQRDNISNPAEGLMIFNAEQGAYQFWANSNWVDLGAGMPNGAIAAFASASCPSGWSEYTPARGRFLRGIDPTGTLDPDGVRTAGSTQNDALQAHRHWTGIVTDYNNSNEAASYLGDGYTTTDRQSTSRHAWSTENNTPRGYGVTTAPITDGSTVSYSYTQSTAQEPDNTSARTDTETRPVNVAVTFCQYDGGAQLVATPSGSAGEVQFADGSGGLSSNANFVYTGVNLGVNTATPQTTLEVGGTISTTSLFVNGTQVTGGGSADNLGNHTASQTLNLNGNWLSGDGDAEGLQVLADGTVSASGIVSATAFVGDGSSLTGISTGSADQVVSGTTNITANENSSISFTTTGTERMVLDSSGLNVAGIVSSTGVSATYLQLSSATQVISCTSNEAGSLRYSNGRIQTCDGTAWSSLALGNDVGVVTGSYTGDGSSEQTINVGFRPQMVVVKAINSQYAGQAIAIDGITPSDTHLRLWTGGGTDSSFYSANVVVTNNGFRVSGNINDSSFNYNGRTYFYVAVAPGDTVAADDLGNHTASQTLNLNGNWLSGDGDAEGLQVDASGNISTTGSLRVAGPVSATTVQLNSSGSEVCAGVAERGTIRVNPSTHRAEICRP